MNITTQNVVNDFDDEMSENNPKLGTLFGVLAPILVVVVMFIILLFSFYNFHRRLHLKKKHHIDYIRANLPLKRPRISPPTMNTFKALDWKPGSNGKESYSSYSYICVPKEDICDCDTEIEKSSNKESETIVITDKFERKSSGVKKSSCARWKYSDKFDKYRFELVPTLCQPESDYLPGDELLNHKETQGSQMAQKRRPSAPNTVTRSWAGRSDVGDLDLEYSHKINCRTRKDKSECSIQKVCSFRDGKYAMFDEKNSKIKLFDRDFNFLLDSAVPPDCRDMIYTSENEIALTQQDSIIFVNVDDHRFKNSRKKFTLPENSQCFGLVYAKSRLFVTCDIMDAHATLRIMDMKGRIKLTIDNVRGLTENKDFGGFTRPFGKFLAISDPSIKMGSVYLSDNEGVGSCVVI